MTTNQRYVLIVSILASSVAFLDGSVVNVALPAISRSLGGGLVGQQWVVDAYLLTLGSLILTAGSLSDLLGRKRILAIGLVGFGITSIICAGAPSIGVLVAARALQGVAGALLVPSSLALIIAAFENSAQSKAIGTWTAWIGISYVIGPLVGGLLVDSVSWRVIFLINVPIILLTLWFLTRCLLKEKTEGHAKVDIKGAVLCSLGLAGSVFALIEQPHYGWSSPLIYLPLIIGLALLAVFIWLEGRIKDPMLTLELFKVRNFSVGNLATVAIYAGLSVATFLIIITVQEVGHYSALEAGLSFLPVTIIMFLLSSRFGALAGKFGPRAFMSIGPLVAAIGFLLLLRTTAAMNYPTQLLPGILIFGLGLSMTVAPLTAAILGGIPPQHAGVGSAVNNAVSRIAGLVSIAAIGLIVGSHLTVSGFHKGVLAMAVLLLAGALISAIGIQNIHRQPDSINRLAIK